MKDEQEINLRFTIYKTLKSWRRIALVAIILALLFGGYKTYVLSSKYNDNIAMEKERAQFQIEMDNYREKGDSLTSEINNLKKSKLTQDEYNNNSILMKINPFNEYVCSFSVYVDSNYKILPELSYQNIDNTKRLLDAYSNYLTQGELYSEIMENSSQISERRYLTEIISTNVSESSALINIKVVNVNEESCTEIKNLIMTGLSKKTQELQDLIGEHSCTVVNESSYENVNLDLDKLQQANNQYVAELVKNLFDKTQEYNKWVSAGEPVFEYNIERIVKSIIKTILLTGLIGTLLGLVYYFFIAITSNKISSTKELKDCRGITVIGEIPTKRKRKFHFVDKWFAWIGEVNLKSSDYDHICKYIGRNIQGMLSEKEQTVVFVSTSNKEKVEPIISKIEKNKGSHVFKLAGNILMDSFAIDLVQNADCVVLVEEQDKATYTQLQDEIDHIMLWKKSVLGVILIETDAL